MVEIQYYDQLRRQLYAVSVGVLRYEVRDSVGVFGILKYFFEVVMAATFIEI
jgi:hypothetical protein